MGRLRKTDPAMARRVQRALDPYLKENVFPRRGMAWQESLEGTRARLALLAENPYLEDDVSGVRQALGLAEVQFRRPEDAMPRPWPGGLIKKPEEVARILENDRIATWLRVHRAAASGPGQSHTVPDSLPNDLRELALTAGSMDLTRGCFPNWLARPPCGPAPFDASAPPIDWAVGRMIERHRLPRRLAPALTFYVLSKDKMRLRDHEPLDVSIIYENAADPWAFTVIVKSVDEFITKDD